MNARAADPDAADGLSHHLAESGIHPRSLHDEALLEASFAASDPLLDLTLRVQRWLEHAAAERVRIRELDASHGMTRGRLEARFRQQVRARHKDKS